MPESDIISALANSVSTEFVGRNILYYATIPSTMSEAKRAAREGAAEGTVVIAEEQTSGRGRVGRTWLSPRGSISISLVLYPTLEQLPRLNMIASLAVALTLEELGIKTKIKWPNDVLINRKKVCGILMESSFRGHSVEWAIIGIGLNLNVDVSSLPEISATATSVHLELEQPVSLPKFLERLLTNLERLYLALRRGEPVHQEWQSRLVTVGQIVRVQWDNSFLEGYAESVDQDGSLLLRLPDGTVSRITAGEVTLRP